MAENILDEKVRDRDIHTTIEGHRPLATVTMKGPMGEVICNDDPKDIAFWKNKGCKIVKHNPPAGGGTDIVSGEETPDEGDGAGEE
jgi:hypothetical protein